MNEIIEINYISPMSNYKFDIKHNKYYLVFINSFKSNNITINKIEIKDINNINESIRSYYIGRAIKITSENSYYLIRLFEHDMSTKNINLLFSGKLELTNSKLNNVIKIVLQPPTRVINSLRSTIYVDDTDFLDEQFYNYETLDNSNKCILFITRMHGSDMTKNVPIIKPYIYKFDASNKKYIYDRYNNCVIKEHQLYTIDIFCKNNTYNDYIKFIKLYNIDTNKYENKDNDTFKSMFMRKINSNFRLLRTDPYLNNIIVCPIDGRLSAFNIDKSLKFKLSGKEFEFNDLVSKPYELINKNGFMIRSIPSDYQRIHIPYSASLKEIGIYGNINELYYISMRFETDYYIPPNVHEREYISVIYGNGILEARTSPELLDVQPHNRLIYHLILIGGISSNSISFINNKVLDLKEKVTINNRIRIKPIEFNQGEELAVFNCCFGNTIFMTNRPVKFASDIKFYSELNKPIESYIRCKDIVGLLQ